MDRVRDLASKKAAVIFTKSSCCMCHSIKQLFYELGASPEVHELDNDSYGKEMEWAIRSLGCNPSVPAVFIGGRFVDIDDRSRNLETITTNTNPYFIIQSGSHSTLLGTDA
ncbi:hypothetical protein Lal_00036450 [Lupinus albus]|nr:hypothetical protein Lal_00036450 [Lupinus albus]